MSTMLRVASHLAATLLLTLPLACSGHPDTCCTETVSRTTVQGECCPRPDLKDGKCRCTACECGTTGKCTCTSGGKRLKDPCACRCGCLSTGKCVCTPDKAR